MMTQLNTGRLFALIIKEFQALFRDPKGRIVVILPPLLQLIIFSFAATLDVDNVSLAIINHDNGHQGQNIVQEFIGSPTFTNLVFTQDRASAETLLDNQEIIAVIVIPQDFSRKIAAKETADIQVLLDGRKSNSAQIVNGYINQLVESYVNRTIIPIQTASDQITLVDRNWFNDNLTYMWFTLPSLVGILAMLVTLIVTALSIARERELGTFNQLLVSPLNNMEILLGKTIPALLIGIAEGCLIVAIAVFIFQVPFTGSVGSYFFALSLFVFSIVGFGLFISSLSNTQQQAILGTFIFMVPVVSLSGYASPVENMPLWLQYTTWFNPLKHFLIISKGVFLKDLPFSEILNNAWPLPVIGCTSLLIAAWYFKRNKQ